MDDWTCGRIKCWPDWIVALGRQAGSGRKGKEMMWTLGVIIAAVFVYLTYVLLHPEKF
ncbi:K(+)-transporting ATPase subunit F [Paenibacillus herberti]|uniref:K(+)-transporting ATPase subunit F n=1 Tax=Paenibacillus herberti TaxID=1619309 RepID=A0A229P3J4_9BACL|nr:K(+)-transporting ATPase subunit F [Paenibacillus herberti]